MNYRTLADFRRNAKESRAARHPANAGRLRGSGTLGGGGIADIFDLADVVNPGGGNVVAGRVIVVKAPPL